MASIAERKEYEDQFDYDFAERLVRSNADFLRLRSFERIDQSNTNSFRSAIDPRVPGSGGSLAYHGAALPEPSNCFRAKSLARVSGLGTSDGNQTSFLNEADKGEIYHFYTQ